MSMHDAPLQSVLNASLSQFVLYLETPLLYSTPGLRDSETLCPLSCPGADGYSHHRDHRSPALTEGGGPATERPGAGGGGAPSQSSVN